MYLDVADLRTFYDLPMGRLLRVLIGGQIRALWPNLENQSLLGIGYAGPFMRPYLGSAERCVAAMPAQQGAVGWPRELDNSATLVEDSNLPFSDAFFDRVIAVHALDHAADASSILHEAWRVLAPGGRLIVIVPNRSGLWSQSELSPFGYGRPYSRSQLKGLLRSCQFDVVAQKEALFLPPTRARFVLRSARTWEGIGRRLWPAFGGLLIVEAEKKVYRGVPKEGLRSPFRVLRPVFVPEGATAGMKPIRRSS
ncbi:class I SAM-dependent methyltransferase [Roseibium algae]|uniref:Methyltransferase domain-containing protein n=1 Tax=Roseibium algae TaxID=3123038 RepID=A0ABU8TQ59_9HYPH